MKNIDKVRAMTAEELTDLLLNHDTTYCRDCIAYDYCKPNYVDKAGKNVSCWNSIREWLNQEVKPMPEIKAGDLLFYGKGKESYYVAIAPDKLVTLREYVVVDLENAIRNDSIIAVKRYNDGGFATIWRVNND